MILRRDEGVAVSYVAATAVIVFAMTGIYRSLFVAGALAQGPFCLVGGL